MYEADKPDIVSDFSDADMLVTEQIAQASSRLVPDVAFSGLRIDVARSNGLAHALQ
jgi:hypothetical protein